MTEREKGYYWVKVRPKSAGFPIARYDSGSWHGLSIARHDSGSWQLPGVSQLLKDPNVEVLSERIRFPASELAELLVGVVLKTVHAEPMEGENAVLDFDRDELVARFEAILREGLKEPLG